jgi:DNA (cytosine-5)-methyltransferase 1
MKSELESAGYTVDHEIYSPQDFGIPQHRKRIFIVGSLVGLDHFSFDDIDKQKKKLVDIYQFIEKNPEGSKKLPKANLDCIKLWQEFIDCIPKETKLPGFPIWGMEFGADYPYEEVYPHLLSDKKLSTYKGNFGCSLKGMNREEMFKNLPSYARVENEFPDWKQNYIRQSRKFYQENKKYVQEVVKEIAKYESQSWQKL